jgi:hypothetical protein
MISNSMSIPLIDANTTRIEIEIPKALREPLGANKHLIPRFIQAVMGAVQTSFNHPDTRLKGEVRDSEIKLRTNMCYEIIRQMYYDNNLSIIRSLDMLEQVLIDSISMNDAAAGGTVEQPLDPTRWSPGANQVQEEACVQDDDEEFLDEVKNEDDINDE